MFHVRGDLLALFWTMAGLMWTVSSLETPENSSVTDSTVLSSTSATTSATTRSSCREQNGTSLALTIVGSVVSGFILGVVVACGVWKYLDRRKRRLPPKDYQQRSGAGQYDVNRNSDGSLRSPGQPLVKRYRPKTKVHKKLERISKPTLISLGEGTPPFAIPLIQKDTDLSATEESEPAPQQTYGDPGRNLDHSSDLYMNMGEIGALSQPYETLEVIQEEAEYENARTSISETLDPGDAPQTAGK